MHAHIVHREAGEVLNARLQVVGHTRFVLFLYGRIELALQRLVLVFFPLYGLFKLAL